jgi:hypothetical protein
VSLAFQLGFKPYYTYGADFFGYQAKTDADGHFVFAQVPPGHQRLAEMFEVSASPSPSGTAWSPVDLTNVDISPGQTTFVTVQGSSELLPNVHVSHSTVSLHD